MHWTYEPATDKSEDLRQGDILEPNETLSRLFGDVHRYFTDKKYRGFLILSQTCDLVKNRCTTHINLAVIRSLQDIISDSLKNEFAYLAPGIYDSQRKKMVESLAERLVNQNENSLGLFYLHPEADAGIAVHSVAILRVSISVKALHYDTLISARVGRLSTEFQPKLGWMVGNLYSRVGVLDWKEAEKDAGVSEARVIKDILSFAKREQPLWLDKRIYNRIIKSNPNFADLPDTLQNAIIKDFMPPPPKEEILNIITKVVKNIVPKIKDKHLDILRQRLNNDELFESKLRKFGSN